MTQSGVPESILRKIEKCLALGASSNEHEAAAALRQAQKLMEAYSVTPEGLAAAKIGTANARTDAWTRPPAWELDLMNVLKRAFGCDAVLCIGDSYTEELTEVAYIGLKHQAQLAAYAHEVLRRQVVKARAKVLENWPGRRGAKIAAGESYCRAYVSVLGRQASELAVSADLRKARDEAVKALLTYDPEDERAQYKPRRTEHNPVAAYLGAEDGKKAQLHAGVDGRTQLKIGKD